MKEKIERLGVIVCGGRNYSDSDNVWKVLDELHERRRINCIIHGGATGADTFAGRWATGRGVLCTVFRITPIMWSEYGLAAGPIRNKRMLKELMLYGKKIVVAFPGGRGTANMVNIAGKSAGVEIITVQQ